MQISFLDIVTRNSKTYHSKSLNEAWKEYTSEFFPSLLKKFTLNECIIILQQTTLVALGNCTQLSFND